MTTFRTTARLGALALVSTISSVSIGCSAVGPRKTSAESASLPSSVRLVRTPGQDRVSLRAAADELASADVVFLGELHDNGPGHAAQLALTRALVDLRPDPSPIISLEMFERDAQPELDLYLAGAIDEEKFLETARAWPNYDAHYRPVIELAKAEGLRVLAANCYRPIAARVARRGLLAGVGDPWAADSVDTSKGEYRRRFDEVMGAGHDVSEETLDNIYAAQCIKDATMAESIAEALEPHADTGAISPLVIHWNGRFHSDYGLGTVERLKRRRPDLNVAVVSMVATSDPGRSLSEDELDLGHLVILVPPSESR